MNSLPYASHWEADALLNWYDNEPSLRICIVTGSPPASTKTAGAAYAAKAPRPKESFCAGQDLIEQGKIRQAELSGSAPPRQLLQHPKAGFMAVSRRYGKKPVIAAVNGYAMGGGFEIVLGCDLVVASPEATFALPEASRGLYAGAGGLSRLVRIVGLPVATEVAIAGRVLSAKEALELNVINKVSSSHETVVQEAIDMAGRIAQLSPDAVIVSRHGLHLAIEEGSVEKAAQRVEEDYGDKLRRGENIRIGLRAFAEKKKPQWIGSKL